MFNVPALPIGLLNRTLSIERSAPSIATNPGFFPDVYASVESIKCRVRPVTLRELQDANRNDGEIAFVIYTLTDADLKRGDILTDAADSVLYEILGVRIPSDRDHHFEVDAKIVESGA
jgi:hypothetical protein